MTVADLTIFQLYCVIAASASIFGLIAFSLWNVATDAEYNFSWLGYAFLGFVTLGGVLGPALYGAFILYSAFN